MNGSESTKIVCTETKSNKKKNSSLGVFEVDDEYSNDHDKNTSETCSTTESFQFNAETNVPDIKDTENVDNSFSQYLKNSFLNLSSSKVSSSLNYKKI